MCNNEQVEDTSEHILFAALGTQEKGFLVNPALIDSYDLVRCDLNEFFIHFSIIKYNRTVKN